MAVSSVTRVSCLNVVMILVLPWMRISLGMGVRCISAVNPWCFVASQLEVSCVVEGVLLLRSN
eukprot:1254180-Rhodomonas_salina.1